MELFYSFIVDLHADSSNEGGMAFLCKSEAVHCCKVLRHKVGDEIFVTNGEGDLYRCKIQQICKEKELDKKTVSLFKRLLEQDEKTKSGHIDKNDSGIVVTLSVEEVLQSGSDRQYHLTMAVCPTKNIERYEWFVEKATEIGVDCFVPIISSYSIRSTIKKERLEAIALSASKQSLKRTLPRICSPISVADFILNSDNQENSYHLKLIAYCEDGEKKFIRNLLDKLKAEIKEVQSGDKIRLLILIGPEGDFSNEEIELSQKSGFVPITLGSSRLRVETAALVAVSEVYFSLQA